MRAGGEKLTIVRNYWFLAWLLEVFVVDSPVVKKLPQLPIPDITPGTNLLMPLVSFIPRDVTKVFSQNIPPKCG